MLGRFGFAAALAVGAAVAPSGGLPPAAPSEAGLAAVAVLRAPSRPTGLPDSTQETAGSFRATGGCDAVRAAYLAPDAPVPAGSEVTVDASGVVQIASPFSRSAVIGDDTSGTCEYIIATEPTVEIEGGATPAVSAFTRVSCSNVIGVWIYVAEVLHDDGTVETFLASPDADASEPDQWKLQAARGSIADLTTGKVGEDAVTLTLTGTGVFAEGTVTVNAGTGEVVRLTCTPAPALDAGS